MDANITKAANLLKDKEREIFPNPDDRLGYRPAEGAIEILPSYTKAGGDLNLMDLPLAVVALPTGGTYEDYIKAVLAHPAAA
jgi:hypothetical protein